MEETVVLTTKELIIASGAICAALFAIWRLFDKALHKMKDNFIRDEAQIREKRELVIEARFIAMEKRMDSREKHDERLWANIDEIKRTINDIKLSNIQDHAQMNQRLAVLEETGCYPTKGN